MRVVLVKMQIKCSLVEEIVVETVGSQCRLDKEHSVFDITVVQLLKSGNL